MSKSQDAKNEQQKDLCITSEQMTEQWKKGELDCGVYYIQSNDGVVFPSVYSAEYDSIKDISIKDFWYEIVDIEKVLAPVPTFEEWQASENYIDYLKQCISVYESKDKQHAKDYLEYEETLEANKQLEHENTLLKIAVAELRDQVDVLKKDSTNGKE